MGSLAEDVVLLALLGLGGLLLSGVTGPSEPTPPPPRLSPPPEKAKIDFSNPFVRLLLLLVAYLAIAWVSVIIGYGWAGLVQIQTGEEAYQPPTVRQQDTTLSRVRVEDTPPRQTRLFTVKTVDALNPRYAASDLQRISRNGST